MFFLTETSIDSHDYVISTHSQDICPFDHPLDIGFRGAVRWTGGLPHAIFATQMSSPSPNWVSQQSSQGWHELFLHHLATVWHPPKASLRVILGRKLCLRWYAMFIQISLKSGWGCVEILTGWNCKDKRHAYCIDDIHCITLLYTTVSDIKSHNTTLHYTTSHNRKKNSHGSTTHKIVA